MGGWVGKGRTGQVGGQGGDAVPVLLDGLELALDVAGLEDVCLLWRSVGGWESGWVLDGRVGGEIGRWRESVGGWVGGWVGVYSIPWSISASLGLMTSGSLSALR